MQISESAKHIGDAVAIPSGVAADDNYGTIGMSSGDNLTIAQNAAGNLVLNVPTGQSILFQVNGVTKFTAAGGH